jgi:hypothetical protein
MISPNRAFPKIRSNVERTGWSSRNISSGGMTRPFS